MIKKTQSFVADRKGNTCACGFPYYVCSLVGDCNGASIAPDGQLEFDFHPNRIDSRRGLGHEDDESDTVS